MKRIWVKILRIKREFWEKKRARKWKSRENKRDEWTKMKKKRKRKNKEKKKEKKSIK